MCAALHTAWPGGRYLARRFQQHRAVRVQHACHAVDPAPIDKFLHHRFTGEADVVVFLESDQPDRVQPFLVMLQPVSRFRARPDQHTESTVRRAPDLDDKPEGVDGHALRNRNAPSNPNPPARSAAGTGIGISDGAGKSRTSFGITPNVSR